MAEEIPNDVDAFVKDRQNKTVETRKVALKNIEKAQERQRRGRSSTSKKRKRQNDTIEVGQPILVTDARKGHSRKDKKMDNLYSGPFTVTQVSESYVIYNQDGVNKKARLDRAKLFRTGKSEKVRVKETTGYHPQKSVKYKV